ncbi:hypothetical protein AXE65_01865 [Ventosimonas gracilis]|uniref:Restriction endonuclease n=1 Tax=Ventosimonas gracilis TaxID=1680762 RepID=A0A139SUQ9_9GAMM|nr:AlwI family type II restriction endonuclease [Ventosimonas gracilis]KXU38336.1 hypothetical protein AXE65_01865 [Ventosimonas gracilis]
MLWHIGNTTVRTPYRLQEALRVLLTSPLNGNLLGREQEHAFARLLHESGIVEAGRVERGEDASDLGRKWRSALSQLGFITPQLTRLQKATHFSAKDDLVWKYAGDIATLSGKRYEITPSGYRLAKADVIAAQQECFLRSIAAYQIPSQIETGYKCRPFSPLRFVLDVICEIESSGADPVLGFDEFALFVQTKSPDDGANNVVAKILSYRMARQSNRGQVRLFDRAQYETVATEVKRQTTTLKDYADLSFRYLRATGLFQSNGRGICLSSRKIQLTQLIRRDGYTFHDAKEYFQTLWVGASLPTDDANTSLQVATSLAEQLTSRGVTSVAPPAGTPVAEIEAVRHAFEERLSQLDEEEFAAAQAGKVQEIADWMDAIASGKSGMLADGTQIKSLGNERPAYLEWIVWRTFLAMDSLVIPAWQCRNFKIDQDFLPVHCAPGGRPDMVFEFEDMIVVVEVTLTSSSRQEATEGEPVRRHVARYAQEQGGKKWVCGLFIALQIDSNTAHTFSSGTWYAPNDSKIPLRIVPMTLADFRTFLLAGQKILPEMPQKLRTLLTECRAESNREAPQWKSEISRIVHSMAQALRATTSGKG